MPIVRLSYTVDADALANEARIADEEDRERFSELAREAEARPGAAVYESRSVKAIDGDNVVIDGVTIDGVTFTARPLSKLFKQETTVYPYVATCGSEMAAYGKKLSDPLEQYWWDLLMRNAVGAARKALFEEIERVAGYKPTSANPGSIESWPISNQPALFSLIGDVEKLIGVTIAPSFLMVPLKSVSGILFQSEGGFTHNCCLCERQDCPGRSAPFDAALKAELDSNM